MIRTLTLRVYKSGGYLCSAEVLGLWVVQARPHGKLPQARRAVDGRRLHRGRGVLDHRDLRVTNDSTSTV